LLSGVGLPVVVRVAVVAAHRSCDHSAAEPFQRLFHATPSVVAPAASESRKPLITWKV
jgi:hypothetical protein